MRTFFINRILFISSLFSMLFSSSIVFADQDLHWIPRSPTPSFQRSMPPVSMPSPMLKTNLPKDFVKIHSGSFDLTTTDQKTTESSDFFDYSKTFYQEPYSLIYGVDGSRRDEKFRSLLYFFAFRVPFPHFRAPLHSISFLTKEKFFTPTGYRETRIFVNDLLNRHQSQLNKINHDEDYDNGKRNVYVFIGTSATAPIIAFLEALQQKSDIIQRPGFRRSLDRSVFIDIPYSFELLKESARGNLSEKDLFAHFSNYLDPTIIEGNNLIFVDLAMSGLNIGSFMRNFKKFLISSNVHEANLYADIFTFLPHSIEPLLLQKLRKIKGIKVKATPWRYWFYLMTNLYHSDYDDIYSYYDRLIDDSRVYYDYNGNYLLDTPFPRDSLYFNRERMLSRSEFEKKYFLVNSKYSSNWIDYVKTNQKAPVSSSYINLKEKFSKVIENDLFFTSSSSCIFLFGN